MFLFFYIVCQRAKTSHIRIYNKTMYYSNISKWINNKTTSGRIMSWASVLFITAFIFDIHIHIHGDSSKRVAVQWICYNLNTLLLNVIRNANAGATAILVVRFCDYEREQNQIKCIALHCILLYCVWMCHTQFTMVCILIFIILGPLK